MFDHEPPVLRFAQGLFFVFVLFAAGRAVEAARDLETDPARASGIEIVVVEAEGCIYCRYFRRDVLPRYLASPRARTVPMRFTDLNEIENRSAGVDRPIDNVPTVLVLKDNHEVGRVSGYVGPENFFQAINNLLSGLE